MEKKLEYQKPSLRRVRLDIRTSVLSVCNTSIVSQPKGVLGCKLDPACFTAPPG